MATLSSKVTPTGVATAAQGTLADTAVQNNDSPTFATVSTTAVTGDGSGLTSLTSANLTGTLPAIDGSALTGGLTKSWTSNEIAWVKDTTFTITHGLGVIPKAYSVEYVCKVAVYGYAVGDTMFNMGERYSGWGQYVGVPTSTTVKLFMVESGIIIRRNDQDTNVSNTTNGYFNVRVNLLG
tara:strand:+ start:181 stop:723 length:543 start_codon:yes stop_codon:yes gene_type:complete